MNKHYTGWRKSTHSAPDGHCVEAGRASDGTIGIRDTKLNDSPVLEFSSAEWAHILDRFRHDN